MESQFTMEEVNRLVNSCHGYHSHLKWLISTAGEMIEWCNNNISEMDDETLLADLTEQLEQKRTILLDLDRQISAGIWNTQVRGNIYNLSSPQQYSMSEVPCGAISSVNSLSSLIITLTSVIIQYM